MPITVRYRKEKEKRKSNGKRECERGMWRERIYRRNISSVPAKVVASILAALVVVLVMVSAAIANEGREKERERKRKRE